MEPRADHLAPSPATQGLWGTAPAFTSDGICHTLAFPRPLLLLTVPLGAAGSTLAGLPRVVSQQADILKEGGVWL